MPDRRSVLDDAEALGARVADMRRQRDNEMFRCSCQTTGDIDVFGKPIQLRDPFCLAHGVYAGGEPA